MDFFHSAAQRRPGGLRWPGPESDLSSLTIRVDLGPRISMMKLADSVSDLASVVELGTKWGESLAQSAAAWDVAYVLRRGDRHGLERLLDESWAVVQSPRNCSTSCTTLHRHIGGCRPVIPRGSSLGTGEPSISAAKRRDRRAFATRIRLS